MSIGLQLIDAILVAGARHVLRDLSVELFEDVERPIYAFVNNHFQRFGALPTHETLADNGMTLVPAHEPVGYYVDRVRNRLIVAQVRDRFSNLASALQQRNSDDIQAVLAEMMQGVNTAANRVDVSTLQNAFEAVIEDCARVRNNPGSITGVTLGWDYLDDLTSGAGQGDIVTLAARPGLGKSYTLVHMAVRAWEAGHSVLFFSMEMETVQMARRMLGLVAGLNPDRIRRGMISSEAERRMRRVAGEAVAGPAFHIVQGGLSKTTDQVASLVREFMPEITYVDASYLLKPKGRQRNDKRWERLTEVGEEMKGIASDTRMPIVQSVQFSRQAKKGQENDLDQIAGADVVGQISSIVLGMREGLEPNESTQRRYAVLKNRDAPKGFFVTNYTFNPFSMAFIRGGATEEEADGVETSGRANTGMHSNIRNML